VVTGAASGIGLETARQFVREGAIVVAADLDPEALRGAEEELTYHQVRDFPGIRANSILPGWIDTPIFERAGLGRDQVEAVFAHILAKIPCGRIGRPEGVASCTLFLSSEKASYINGACVLIDGGYLRGPDWGI
jgi:NAD(P)-dependent dehydrogenase (short-subunit alcohol dehydrogenase family)